MTSNIFRVRSLAILAALTIMAAFLVWQAQLATPRQNNKAAKTTSVQGDATRVLRRSLINIPFKGVRADSITNAEQRVGFPIKVPKRLFGKNAQVFLGEMTAPNGQNSVNIVYSDETTPTNSEAFINVGWRDPGLAPYSVLVANWIKGGLPYVLYEHKGHAGYALEKGFNPTGPEGNEERPAVVVWLDGDKQYSLYGPIGMGRDQLISIADSID